jgi:hypothetical protein
MQKKLATHKKYEATYKWHLYAFKYAFPKFIYHIPDSSKLSSLAHEVGKVKCSGIIKHKHLKEPQNLRGGGQDTPIVVAKVVEHTQE